MARKTETKETAPVSVTNTLTVVEADEAMPGRTRKAPPTFHAAQSAYDEAVKTFVDGVTKAFRAEGEKASALIAQLRGIAKADNRSIRTAESAKVPGAILWQVIDKPPTKRPRASKKG